MCFLLNSCPLRITGSSTKKAILCLKRAIMDVLMMSGGNLTAVTRSLSVPKATSMRYCTIATAVVSKYSSTQERTTLLNPEKCMCLEPGADLGRKGRQPSPTEFKKWIYVHLTFYSKTSSLLWSVSYYTSPLFIVYRVQTQRHEPCLTNI
eukprot:XP_001706116.1 Hypothetical protein GL50803_18556 [Giardia lamblia ATCC 50803]